MAGGLPGADTAAALAQAHIDPARRLTVSIDAVLSAMAAAGLIPPVPGLAPLEAAGLAHAEAQFLAKRLALRGLAEGRNLVFDISRASPVPAGSWISILRRAGYTVTGIFTDISVEQSVRRTAAASNSTGPAAATAPAISRPRRSAPWPTYQPWRRQPRATPHASVAAPRQDSFLAAR